MGKASRAPKRKKVEKWVCRIPDYWPPSPNVIGGWHWRQKYRASKLAADYVQAYGTPLPAFVGPVLLKIVREWGYNQRALDPDNLVASVKPLIDALRAPKRQNEQKNRLSVIEDDRPDAFEGGAPDVQQRRAHGKEKRTVIVVTGVEA